MRFIVVVTEWNPTSRICRQPIHQHLERREEMEQNVIEAGFEKGWKMFQETDKQI